MFLKDCLSTKIGRLVLAKLFLTPAKSFERRNLPSTFLTKERTMICRKKTKRDKKKRKWRKKEKKYFFATEKRMDVFRVTWDFFLLRHDSKCDRLAIFSKKCGTYFFSSHSCKKSARHDFLFYFFDQKNHAEMKLMVCDVFIFGIDQCF